MQQAFGERLTFITTSFRLQIKTTEIEIDSAKKGEKITALSQLIDQLAAEKAAMSTNHGQGIEEMVARHATERDALKMELELFRQNSRIMLKEKGDQIIILEQQFKLLQEEKQIRTSQELNQQQTQESKSPKSPLKSSFSMLANPTSENTWEMPDPILHFAQMQAMREEEINRAKMKIQELQNLLSEGERMEKLHQLQEQVLKNEIRELQRAHIRESANPEYLKNIILQFIVYEDQRERLLPVIATVLQFSPEEKKKISAKKNSNTPFFKIFSPSSSGH